MSDALGPDDRTSFVVFPQGVTLTAEDGQLVEDAMRRARREAEKHGKSDDATVLVLLAQGYQRDAGRRSREG